jgi:DNA polymerase III subunit delta'
VIDLPDQPLARRMLRAGLSRPRPPQQLLLHGPPGTAKRAAAREVAWALMDPDASHPHTDEALDLAVVRALGAQILLEDLERGLAQIASRPSVMARRVLIIEGAERLREADGAHRLLKTLEEPPPRSHIILVTDHPQELLPTIRSRCLPVPFRNPGAEAIASRLEAAGTPALTARARARAEGPAAVTASPFEVAMRETGVELAIAALRGEDAAGARVAAAQTRMDDAAAANPSAELARLRAEAEQLAGKRGGRTAAKRAEDQEKRERRRMVSDGWATVLDTAAGVAADALALAVGADAAVRHVDRIADLQAVATPERIPFLIRAIEELQQAHAELRLNPTADLAAEAVLVRVDAGRHGSTEPLVPPGRLAV